MSAAGFDGADRREYTRYELAFPVELEVAVAGASPTKLMGTTINLSRGGALLDVPRAVRPGSRCRVRFQHADGRVSPQQQVGKIIHATSWKRGRHAVAVQFREPLDEVKPPGAL